MRPLDPSLLRESAPVRNAIAGTIVVGLFAAAASVVQAGAAAAFIARSFIDGESLTALLPQVWLFLGAWVLRSIAVSAQDVLARRAGLQAVAGMRARIAHAYAAAPQRSASAETLLGRGIDALEVYVAKYLPQLVLAVFVPFGLGLVVLRQDLLSAVILLLTLPLIPAFMALIGWFTQDVVTRQWAAVARITDVILDLFNGLPELVIFGRAKAQAQTIRTLGGNAAHETMRVLRISFLSAMALELIASISVALIAVGIGLRLVNGTFALETGLFILILAPDVYLPVRQVGVQFHAAVEGVEAWNQARPMLVAPAPTRNRSEISDITAIELRACAFGFEAPLVAPVDARFERGTITAIAGHSGVGKTTLLRTIATLQSPLSGHVVAHTATGDVDVHTLAEDAWFPQLAYVPQDPWLGHGTVRDALTRGNIADDDACRAALARVGLGDVALAVEINDLDTGVSIGQRRRIAIARALLRNSPVVLLDEPTAAIDAVSEAAILDAMRTMAAAGAIVIVVAHRPAVVSAADAVVTLGGAR